MKKVIEFIFFGNYFYALCVLALSIESSVQQDIRLNSLPFYILLFSATIVYYTYAYMGTINFPAFFHKRKKNKTHPEKISGKNPRSSWYAGNRGLLNNTQALFIFISLICAFYLAFIELEHIYTLYLSEWVMFLAVPMVALLYYGKAFFPLIPFNLRETGWLKPFVIGFVWAGTVTVYPAMFKTWQQNLHYAFTPLVFWLLVKNWMFISLLCIMFDIKDYADDANQQLKTFVVGIGLRKTIFFILLPLILIGLACLWIYAFERGFSMVRILINTLPFLFLLGVAYSMHRRKSILYYLVIIDGLMLVKGVCGIAGALFF